VKHTASIYTATLAFYLHALLAARTLSTRGHLHGAQRRLYNQRITSPASRAARCAASIALSTARAPGAACWQPVPRSGSNARATWHALCAAQLAATARAHMVYNNMWRVARKSNLALFMPALCSKHQRLRAMAALAGSSITGLGAATPYLPALARRIALCARKTNCAVLISRPHIMR